MFFCCKEAGKRQNRKLIKIDAHGGYGGNFWDDGAFTGIREITLTYDHCIDSIRVEYDLNGKPALAEKHGGAGGQYTAHVSLQTLHAYIQTPPHHYGISIRSVSISNIEP